MKNKRRITSIVVAMLLALVGTVALVAYVQSSNDKAASSDAMVDVYIVGKLVAQGSDADTIRSSVSLQQVPARLVQSGAITNLGDVGDLVAGTDLEPGDQLVQARLVAKGQVAPEAADKVQISTLLAAERAVGGALKKGDLVGVYLSFDPFELGDSGTSSDETTMNPSSAVADATSTTDAPQKKSPNMTRLAFQHVLVTNVQTTEAPVNADGKDDQNVEQVSGLQYVVTLALTPEQSERFVFATEFGHVWLSNEPATVSDDGSRLVTLGNVYKVVK